MLDLLEKTDNEGLKERILYALGEIGDSKAVDPLLDLLERTDNEYLKWSISQNLRGFNPILLYPFLEEERLQYVILDILCSFSTRYSIRFFKDKVVLPEGEILDTGTKNREKSIRKLDRIIKSRSR